MDAASLNVAELYVDAFQQLAKTNNTLILPANAGDVTSMVGQAMTMYKSNATSFTLFFIIAIITYLKRKRSLWIAICGREMGLINTLSWFWDSWRFLLFNPT